MNLFTKYQLLHNVELSWLIPFVPFPNLSYYYLKFGHSLSNLFIHGIPESNSDNTLGINTWNEDVKHINQSIG